MNDGNRNTRNTRSTYYNLDLPEWRCENCGKFNQRDARFCRSCGAPGPVAAPSGAAGEVYVAEMPQRRGGALKWIAIAAAVIIAAALITFAVVRMLAPKEEPAVEPDKQAGQTEAVEPIEPIEPADPDQPAQQSTDGSGGMTATEGSSAYYSAGVTYRVQSEEGLKVREGPGKNYRQIRREDLTGDEYAQSLSGGAGYAALKNGSLVVCQEMSSDGKWMKISSGWICVEDNGEQLVVKD